MRPPTCVSASLLAAALLIALGPALCAGAELPRASVDTTPVPAPGRRINVRAGGDFQAALDMAQPGDVIRLEAGASFTGNFTLPAKTGDGWIIIRTWAPDIRLPAPGTRLTPVDACVLPKIISPNTQPALTAALGAHHYRFIGVEFTMTTDVPINYNLIVLGARPASLADVPHDLVFDRVYIHGQPQVNARRGIALNSAWTAVIDSYIADFHELFFDTQAIAGWEGPGPFKIVGTLPGTHTLDPYFPNYVFERNVLVGGNPSLYPLDSFFPASLTDVGFVDLARGDYRLSPSSPYKNGGTDGEDIGADIDALGAAMAGVTGSSLREHRPRLICP